MNGGVSVSFVGNFYNELLVLVVTFTCYAHRILLLALHEHYILKVTWKFFPLICRCLCEMFGVVPLVTFIMLMIYPLFIAVLVVVVSYLCVYLSCWMATYAHSWINIYKGWKNNGNTRQYRNKTVCVGCTERTLVVFFIVLLFVCLLCSVSVSV